MWVCSSYSARDDHGLLISGLVITGLSSGLGMSLGVILMIRALPGIKGQRDMNYWCLRLSRIAGIGER